ncbi:YkvA family protein [uncultured Variovorax sp.]|uniref:YkvA family protein n=1 Tax=uncultured Variovorax sp. TaxID=114708 RepID=UPI0025DB0F1A|nr:YkvA family protein [uncultured Variovorax sp.]
MNFSSTPTPTLSARLRNWARRLKRDGVTLWFACRHAATPWYAKALGVFVVAYALSPIDLIPDFVPVLGYLDDVLLLPGLIWLTIRLIPAAVLAECREQADAWMHRAGSKPASRWGAALVVAVWITAAAGVWYLWTH